MRLPTTVSLSTYDPSSITTQEQAYLDSVATWSADEGGYLARPPGGCTKKSMVVPEPRSCAQPTGRLEEALGIDQFRPAGLLQRGGAGTDTISALSLTTARAANMA